MRDKMKKIIPFEKDIKFNTKIYCINSISLEHNLKNDATAKTAHALDPDESVYPAPRSQIPISIFLSLITCAS